MSSSNIKLAFVGLGAMGQTAHLSNYLTVPGVEIVAAAELRPELGKKVAARYGIARVYTDHRELLEKESVDGIVAIQQFGVHGQLLPELLAKKVPVLIEKPLARSAEVGERVFAAARDSGTPLYVAYHKRSDPGVMYARKLMGEWKASGQFGKLKYIRLSMPPGPWPSPSTAYDALIGSNEAWPNLQVDEHGTGYSGEHFNQLNEFVNYYIHQVNLMRHLLGEDYRVTYADPAGVTLATHSTSGVPGILEMNAYRSNADWKEEAFIALERAFIRLEIPGPLVLDRPAGVTVFTDLGEGLASTTLPTLRPIHAMRQQAMHFAAAIRGEVTPLCQAEEALKDLRTAREYMDLFLATKKG
jgi:predicted dehydrogenase